jgi:hypothetical protein
VTLTLRTEIRSLVAYHLKYLSVGYAQPRK